MAALFAGLGFRQMLDSDPLETFTTSLMLLVACAALLIVAGACIYRLARQ
ncbi:MAG: hypothetical protein ACK4K7_07545 [Allosphingosinicella sp.]